MKMTGLLRITNVFIPVLMWLLLLCASGDADATDLTLRREYNDVSAAIDSLVRMMRVSDADVLDKLPEGRPDRVVPEGLTAVMIFWADDEARVWLNDFPVGKTRLTPVEVSIPDLYFRGQNHLRVRCWDTDGVESCFLGGLYLKDGAGRLYPVVVSSGEWEADGGQASEIVYAHPLPDIPSAEPIWGAHTFGIVNLSVTFDREAIDRALGQPVGAVSMRQQAMDYHKFAQQIAALQARRENIEATMAQQSDLNIPLYYRERALSASLSLGKTAPLTEEVSAPVGQKTRSWSEKLPAVQRQLIYPTPRALKGEQAATAADGETILDKRGSREQAYRPPEERGGRAQGKRGEKDKGTEGPPHPQGTGRDGASGRATRLGLVLPTLVLGFYVLYAITRWQSITGERN